jgi:hypothetical protein
MHVHYYTEKRKGYSIACANVQVGKKVTFYQLEQVDRDDFTPEEWATLKGADIRGWRKGRWGDMPMWGMLNCAPIGEWDVMVWVPFGTN